MYLFKRYILLRDTDNLWPLYVLWMHCNIEDSVRVTSSGRGVYYICYIVIFSNWILLYDGSVFMLD